MERSILTEIGFLVTSLLVITTSIAYLLLNKTKKKTQFSLNKQFTDTNELESVEDSPTLVLPWEVKSYRSTDMHLYNPPKSMKLTKSLKNRLDHIIELTPRAKSVVKSEKKIVVRFSEEVLNKIKTEELSIMRKKGSIDEFRTIAVDQNNKIRNHGWLEVKDIKKVNPAQLANVALGVMTVITAQAHLDKINQQLTVVDRKIETLLRFHQNGRIGKIQGNIRYLKSILSDIENPTDGRGLYLTHIEDISRQNYQEMQSIILEFPQMLNEIKNIKVKTVYGVDKIVNELKDISSTFEQNLLIAFGNLEVMSICLKLRNDLDANSEVNKNRLLDIEGDYHQLNDFHNTFISVIKEKGSKLDAKFRTSKLISQKKLEIKQQLTFHHKTIIRNRNDIEKHIAELNNINSKLVDGNFDLQIEYDENENITAVSKLKRVN